MYPIGPTEGERDERRGVDFLRCGREGGEGVRSVRVQAGKNRKEAAKYVHFVSIILDLHVVTHEVVEFLPGTRTERQVGALNIMQIT